MSPSSEMADGPVDPDDPLMNVMVVKWAVAACSVARTAAWESVRGRGVAAAGLSTAGSEAKTCRQAESQAHHHE